MKRQFGNEYESYNDLYQRDKSIFLANLINNRSVLLVRDKVKYHYTSFDDMFLYLIYVQFNIFSASIPFHLFENEELLFQIVNRISDCLVIYGFTRDQADQATSKMLTMLYIYFDNTNDRKQVHFDLFVNDICKMLDGKKSEIEIMTILQKYIDFFERIKTQVNM